MTRRKDTSSFSIYKIQVQVILTTELSIGFDLRRRKYCSTFERRVGSRWEGGYHLHIGGRAPWGLPNKFLIWRLIKNPFWWDFEDSRSSFIYPFFDRFAQVSVISSVLSLGLLFHALNNNWLHKNHLCQTSESALHLFCEAWPTWNGWKTLN